MSLSIPLPSAVQQRALVPAWLVTLSAVLVPIAAGANAFLPHPYGVAAGVFAFVAALLAGVAMPQLRFSSPVIPLALVPGAMSASGLLFTLSQSLPSPAAQFWCNMAAGVLAALAGKALPQPTK